MYNGIKVCHIVATDLNGCIGKDNQMPWHLPADLKRFKELTTGGVVIMGRKTFESLDCKPLPNSTNIVLTSKVDSSLQHAVWTAKDIGTALGLAQELSGLFSDNRTIWIIGGAEIYAQTMQYVDAIERTVVITEIADGDAFYPIELVDGIAYHPSYPSPFQTCMPSQNYQDEVSGLRYYYRKLVRARL